MADEKKDEKKPTLLKFEIVDKCPCGTKVDKDDRQQLVFHPTEQKWYRMCLACINRDRVFAVKEAQ